jgi:hypothetical protein
MNATIERFGGATTLIADYPHWVVLLRPQAVTLGSLIIAAKAEATAFSARYDGSRRRNEIEIADAGWPGPPNLAGATPLSDDQTADQRGWLKSLWPARGR